MSRAIFVAIFYVILHFQYVDVYQRSDYETVGHYFQKRQFPVPPESEIIEKAVKTEETHGNVTEKVDAVRKSNVTKSVDRNANTTVVDGAITKEFGRLPHEHNGALFRSFYVFLGLSVIVLLYISFRTFKYVWRFGDEKRLIRVFVGFDRVRRHRGRFGSTGSWVAAAIWKCNRCL